MSYLHAVVYHLGMPWKTGPEVAKDFFRCFCGCRDFNSYRTDLEAIQTLKSDDLEMLLCAWDGTGATPMHLYHEWKAVGIAYVSKTRMKV